MIIQNLMLNNILYKLKNTEKSKSSAAEKLSSGLRINKSADDASGLTISEKMEAQINGLMVASNNIQDGVSYVQTADGALGNVTEILQRMRTLSVQSANDTNTDDDRKSINQEIHQLKDQINGIFESTDFNDHKIWDANSLNKVQIGTIAKQAVTMNCPYDQYFTITDTNKDAIPYSNYTINVIGTDSTDSSTYGIKVSWTGYNGNNYSTKLISWNNLSGTNPSFNLADYLDTTTHPELSGINYKISYNVEETATLSDIAASLNGATFGSSPNTSQSIVNSNSTGDINMSAHIYYLAELASNRTMNSYDTNFIEPNISGSSNVTIPNYSASPEDSSRIKFNFTMPNIGNVTANCSDIQYYSTDETAAGENKWWKYYTNGSSLYKEHIEYTPPISGTGLNSILSCIETNNGYSLTKDASSSGYIVLNYNLTSDLPYSHGGINSNSIGQMTVTINVGDNDTKDDLINKLQSNFNSTSIVDIYEGYKSTNAPSSAYSEVSGAEANPHTIDVPVYKSTNDLKIQAGATENQSIDIIYDTLRATDLGIDNIDALTNSNSTNAINALDGAIGIVNTQRAVFGAYQNELQRANDNVTNSSLNLQSSNSKIKDADMAKEMLKYSKKGILEQASLSLFSQGIKKSTSVLDLLTL